MKSKILTPLSALLPLLLAACGPEPMDWTDTLDTGDTGESDLGEAFEAVNACEGDDLQYDFNSFAASLAVASANELGRWEAVTDFEAWGRMRHDYGLSPEAARETWIETIGRLLPEPGNQH